MNPNPVDLRKILFLDIETVSGYSHYEEMDERGQELWAKKGARQSTQGEAESDSDFAARTYKEKAAIFAEFGQIV
ncbi:MAG: 3'-5' exonuclease, partial [Saprospiraceae bacterium]